MPEQPALGSKPQEQDIAHMHWILQEDFLSRSCWSALTATLERFGIHYSVHAVTPQSGELIPTARIPHKNVICIGSFSMRHTAVANGWIPGVFDVCAQGFEEQRRHWGRHLLNCDAIVSALEDARFHGERMFVRPADDSKYFSGRVFAAQEFAVWQRAICDAGGDCGTSLTPATRIQLSHPVIIFAEYRFWVVNRQIVTQSLYKRGSQGIHASEVDDQIVEFVEQRIKEWVPHESFVIDVCYSENGMKIVEINTLNSSAFYAADVQRLVLALEMAYAEQMVSASADPL
jgi:hypothetical protein